MINYILKKDKLLSFILSVFVFILLVDPTNSIFRIKGLIFLILLFFCTLYSFKIIKFGLLFVIIIYSIILTTFFIGIIFPYEFDYNYTLSVLKGFSPLILLLWIDKISLLKKMIFPSLVVSIIVIITFLIFNYAPTLFDILYYFYMRHDATMMIAKRSFIGFDIISFFYKSLPALIIPFTIYTHKFFNIEKKRIINFTIFFIFLITFFLSGTRSNIIASILVVFIYIIIWLSRFNYGKLLIIPIFTVFFITFSILFFSLLSDKNEESIKIKYSNLYTYYNLAKKHPSIFLFGQGAGSKYYSYGRHEFVVINELTYFEIIRMFGLFGALIIIFLLFLPLYLLYKKRKVLTYWFPVFLGYLFYLLIGGTNPLLIGSTGMLVLLTAYSYTLNPYYKSHIW